MDRLYMDIKWKRRSLKPVLITVIVVTVVLSIYGQGAKGGKTKNTKPAQEDFSHSEFEIPQAKIPLSIRKAFLKKYTGINPDFWLLVEGNYQAQFEFNGKVKTAEFNQKGEWLSCETIIDFQDIPMNTSQYILKNYGGYELNIAILQETAEGNFFAIGIATETDYQELIFDENGNFIQYGDYVD